MIAVFSKKRYTHTMKKRSPALLVVFIYECIKLAVLAELLALFLFSSLPAPNAALAFACTAGFSLFPLMMFFLWFDTERYGAFKSLYMAGKLAAAFCALAAAFSFIAPGFPFNLFSAAALEGAEQKALFFALGLSISAITDCMAVSLTAFTVRPVSVSSSRGLS
jgi:hypothetical protein